MKIHYLRELQDQILNENIWRPPSLSGLTPIIFDMELTHLGLEITIKLSMLLNLTELFIFVF